MRPSSSYFPYAPGRQAASAKMRSARGVADYLQSHEKMRLLLPTAARLAALQKACEEALPLLFEACSVLQFETGQLLIAAQNAAVAAKLRQKLPNLQKMLHQHGWQVSAIRLKVQVGKTVEKSTASKHLALSNRALDAFAELEKSLESSNRNEALKTALQTLMKRHHAKSQEI
ncbi:MAG: DUF721 domain-containing protein [Burkholderiales bacterium]|nr:DUF721 domain-containing protein [Burkholderiales bacterium]